MNEFDPHTDMIDRYLRGELQGDELQAFMTKLQSDPTFKQQVENQGKIAAAIYSIGYAEMKQYLRQKKIHKGMFRLSSKTWYFAAASVMLIAFSAAIIIWKLNPGLKTEQNSTAETRKAADSSKEQNPEFAATERGVKKVNPDTARDTESILQNNEELTAAMESDDAGSKAQAADQEPIIIASNVQAVAIVLSNPADAQKSLKTEASEMNRTRAVESDVQHTTSGQTAKAGKAGPAESVSRDYKQPEQIKSKRIPMRFSLTFCETPRNKSMLEIDRFNDIYFVRCFDIVYGNPLVYEWQNRYFLHSGLKTYELKNLPTVNGQKSPLKETTEVTDPAILKLIGQ